ncbi:LOW QUALITY PROTEIN: fatty-acid amide hydrolase 2 [Megaptera novaeangliae]
MTYRDFQIPIIRSLNTRQSRWGLNLKKMRIRSRVTGREAAIAPLFTVRIQLLLLQVVGFLLGLVGQEARAFGSPKFHSSTPRPVTDPLLLLLGMQMAKLIQQRKAKCIDVVQIFINRIKDVNPMINGIIKYRCLLTHVGVVSNKGQFPMARGAQEMFMFTGPMCRYAEVMAWPGIKKLKLNGKVHLRDLKFYMEHNGGSYLMSKVDQYLILAQKKAITYDKRNIKSVIRKGEQ